MSPPLPQDDLDDVVRHVGGLWGRLAGARVLFTGASGFFGSWMLETFLYAGTELNIPLRAVAVTRDAQRFSRHLPHLAGDPRVEILESDVATLPVPDGPVDFIVHSLFAPATLPEMERHYEMATGRLLEIAAEKSVCGCLLCSTGAVYKPSRECSPIQENSPRFGTSSLVDLSPSAVTAHRSALTSMQRIWRFGCGLSWFEDNRAASTTSAAGPRSPLGRPLALSPDWSAHRRTSRFCAKIPGFPITSRTPRGSTGCFPCRLRSHSLRRLIAHGNGFPEFEKNLRRRILTILSYSPYFFLME